MAVELERPRHQDAVAVAVVIGVDVGRFVVVVVARARALVGDAERESAGVSGLAPMSERRELVVRIARTELELVVC